MHCNICDRTLSPEEIIFNKQLKAFEPCSTCLDVIFETAFSDGYVGDEELVQELEQEEGDSPQDV